MIVLVVEDDGKGFNTDQLDPKEGIQGLGLVSMHDRVETFDGDFSISSNPENGTEIVIEVPCRKRKKNGNN